ncbi:hypothetical protein [Paenibacillus lautus]|uniref:hypothetical protein n=1 Tax=Paenibacillus lautus TaxID=1401 RepID=UPI002DBF51D9|nr:hypothetical protein [Paenibacillus lautus]MEC0255587.1 hypothetical protein [Paenibacillus lautus]
MIRRLLPEELGGLLETINREQHFLYYSYLAFRKKHTVHYGQFSECGELSTPSRSDDYVELGNIGTDTAWRRQGDGKKVCAELNRKGRAINHSRCVSESAGEERKRDMFISVPGICYGVQTIYR